MLMKSLCIKTNNCELKKYLLNELENSKIEDVIFSTHNFKYYCNIIIHYTGSEISVFLDKLSYVLSLCVIDELEEDFLKNIIFKNYFYFDSKEREQILYLCFDNISYDFTTVFDKKIRVLSKIFKSYLTENKALFLDGFVNFRLQEYMNILDDLVYDAVNSYLIEQEYLEFISLLKLYINTEKPNCKVVHMFYGNSEAILLDENKEIISVTTDAFNSKYLSDISFSANDYTLNALLTLLPEKIYIHLVDPYADEFIFTLQSIFDKRISVNFEGSI